MSVQNTSSDFLWGIYEDLSEQVVETHVFEEDAKRRMKFMRGGGGFNGFTPAFMLIDFETVDGEDV